MKTKQVFINSQVSAPTRREILNNEEHLIIPVVAAKVGVMNNVFYSNRALGDTFEAWNGVPIPVTHPTVNGEFVSANSPEFENTQNIGTFYHVNFEDNKLKGEIWLNLEKAERLGFSDVVDRFEKGELMEVSTGLFSNAKSKKGMFNNESFDFVAEDISPDHLALLPNEVGACSLEDGCGAMVTNCECKLTNKEKIYAAIKLVGSKLGLTSNVLSDNDVHRQLNSLIDSEESVSATGEKVFSFIVDVFPDFFVFEREGKLFRRDYSINNDVVELGAGTQEVIRKTSFDVVGNKKDLKGDSYMTKDELVKAIIANTNNSFSDSDSETLKSMDEDVLKKVVSNEEDAEAGKETDGDSEGDSEEPKKDGEEAEESKKEDEPKVEANLEQKADSSIEAIKDPEVKEFLSNALDKQRSHKAELVVHVASNSKFEASELESMDTKTLETLKQSLKPVPDYSGRGLQAHTAKTYVHKGILIKTK